MKPIFPSAMGGDLLKITHFSNASRMADGVKLFQVGDACKAEAQAAPPSAPTKAKATSASGGKHITEAISSFLYYGCFAHYESTFGTTEELGYLVPIKSDTQVEVLLSKERFKGENELPPFLAGTFRT